MPRLLTFAPQGTKAVESVVPDKVVYRLTNKSLTLHAARCSESASGRGAGVFVSVWSFGPALSRLAGHTGRTGFRRQRVECFGPAVGRAILG